MIVPSRLARTVSGFRDGAGCAWLARLPDLVARCCHRWSLEVGEPFGYASLSLVAPARLPDGRDVVLKVGFLEEEMVAEAAALTAIGGEGAVRLIGWDPEACALLMERALPGTDLTRVRDDVRAVSVAADVMRRLWRPATTGSPLPTLAGWADGLAKLRAAFHGGTGPLPAHAVARAECLLRDLLASSVPPLLLHGDCHHFNVLRAERASWLAIDPKGVVGDPAYEPAPFMANRWQRNAHPVVLLERRADQFSEELGLPRERVRAWGLAHAVLSAWWHIEDSGRCPAAAARYIELMEDVARS